MCPHCAAVAAVAIVTSLPLVKPTVNYYRTKRAQKKEKKDAASEEG